jgi:protein gp37
VTTGTSIEWTEATWNPVTGCSKVSPGCAHCYAERMAKRLQAMGQRNYIDGFAVRSHPHMLDVPRGWGRPRHIFVNSMGDLFHEEVELSFVERVFRTMNDHGRGQRPSRSDRAASRGACRD